MKKFYKAIILLTMAVGLFFTIPTPLKAMAKTINAVNASVSSSEITVSGTAEAGTVACVVLVYDQSGTTLQAMETCAVAGDNTYSYTLTQEFAAGTYLIKVADYEGGEYASTLAVVAENTKPEDGSDNIDRSSDDDDDDDSSSASAKEEKVNVPVEYTVVKGDTLSKIAYKNQMTLSALLALNPQIKNPNLIYPGQKIIVGHTSKTAASQSVSTINPNAVYYTVQKGDFLYRIARKNGLTLAQLGAMNPEIVKQKYIYAGQKVRIK
ncbi:MAG: LysM peptidoglycan-binding domain-containing protein [Acetatifactor sp.]